MDVNIELQSLDTNLQSVTNDVVSQSEPLIVRTCTATVDKSMTDTCDKRIAAQVKNVVFSYGRGKKAVTALNGITINVPEGNIYSILGPSGCGKTTLVHCLVGSLKPRKGTVIVFGEEPGSFNSLVPGPGVGYMPQEIGLFQEFTIEETLIFFGRLYRLPKAQIKQSIRFLLDFLELPDKSSSVAKLSGGQKRRVSLAAALVHKPPLLVLDEPTVGIDPVLRQSIWKHLIALAKDNITVIITTHYIEEARNASIVAFMRQGMLLEEGNPEVLIKRHKVNNLEDVFLRLCNNKESDLNINLVDKSRNSPPITQPNDLNDILVNNKSLQKTNSLKPSKILMKRNKIADHFARSEALFLKNVIRMYRNLPAFIFTAIVPAVQCALFFLCLGRDPYDIPVAIFNGEPLVARPHYSTLFLQFIDNYTINQNHYNSFDSAYQSVKDGHNKAMIALGTNFSKAMIQRGIHGYDSDPEDIEMSAVKLYLDMTSQFSANKIRQTMHESYQLFAKDILKRNEMNEALVDPPIREEEPILGSRNPPVTHFMAPGFILSLAFFCAIATSALSLVLERKDGLLERSLVSGVHPNEYILSHVLTQTLVVILQTLSVLMIAFLIFEIPNRGSIFWVSVLIVMQGVCGMAYGILISAITKEENFTLILCMGSMFPQFLLSGVVWPVETMPKILIFISTVFSQAKSIEAVRYMLYRGWGLDHFEVYLGFIISGSWTLVFLCVAAIMFNVNKSR
ncbi:ABC transporter G family member 20-like [Oppia nitens]|uniref:ABC transporter G family member 20-like n=1 Tax=Oppia nitens TaxID=1686743 RepID=UPI0023D9E588|nr:ABC transporter G family member 20-like [Oppia nitens]